MFVMSVLRSRCCYNNVKFPTVELIKGYLILNLYIFNTVYSWFILMHANHQLQLNTMIPKYFSCCPSNF